MLSSHSSVPDSSSDPLCHHWLPDLSKYSHLFEVKDIIHNVLNIRHINGSRLSSERRIRGKGRPFWGWEEPEMTAINISFSRADLKSTSAKKGDAHNCREIVEFRENCLVRGHKIFCGTNAKVGHAGFVWTNTLLSVCWLRRHMGCSG